MSPNRRFHTSARVRLAAVAARVRAAARGARGTIALLAVAPGLLFAAPAKELVGNAQFAKGDAGWKRYESKPTGEAPPEWDLSFGPAGALIAGRGCAPRVRIGFRSEAVKLESVNEYAPSTRFTWTIDWGGAGIHRAGAYLILQSADDKTLATAVWRGPSGDFEEKAQIPFELSAEDIAKGRKALLYAFHDGPGTLTVKRVALDIEGTGGFGPALADSVPSWEMPFPALPESPSLLKGEVRWFEGEDATTATMALAPREVALVRELSVLATVPTWVVPPKTLEAGPQRIVQRTGVDGAELAPLPADHHAYLFYYGALRYGGKERDAESDRHDLAMIREAGFTGLAVQDSYGLDYKLWREGKELDPSFLLKFARLYRDSGLRSPLVYKVFSGLDKGRVSGGDPDELARYLNEIRPYLDEARTVLDGIGFVVWPVDEPNDKDRQALASKLQSVWAANLGSDFLVTGNGHTAQVVNMGQFWAGAGEWCSPGEAKPANVTGVYYSVDGAFSPVALRRIAGVYTWANGFPTQAWWHFYDPTKDPMDDLDGDQADFYCVAPPVAGFGRVPTLGFLALQEGLQDWRLLLGLEAKLATAKPDVRSKIEAFLTATRNDCGASERPGGRFATGAGFEAWRTEAVELTKAASN